MGAKEVEMGAAVPSKDDIQTQLQEQYLKSLEGLEEGDLVDGHVIQVTDDFIFVDVGYKSEGKIPIVEFGGQSAQNRRIGQRYTRQERDAFRRNRRVQERGPTRRYTGERSPTRSRITCRSKE